MTSLPKFAHCGIFSENQLAFSEEPTFYVSKVRIINVCILEELLYISFDKAQELVSFTKRKRQYSQRYKVSMFIQMQINFIMKFYDRRTLLQYQVMNIGNV